MRALPLFLIACTGTPSSMGRATPTQLQVRLAEARHAAQVDLDVFVWPTSAPQTQPTEAQCDWWADRQGGRPTAVAGLNDGSLGWGAIHITPAAIGMGGVDLLPLDAGRLGSDQLDGAIIPALYGAVVEARRRLDGWYEACGEVYRDRPLLAVDADVPQSTVSRVLITLSLARFPRVAMLVGDRDPTNAAQKDRERGVLAVIRQRGPEVQIMDGTGLLRLTGPVADSESMLAKATSGPGLGCALLIPERQARWADVAATIDTTTAFGSASTLIANSALHLGAEADEPGPAAQSRGEKSPSEWLSLDNTAAVHWIDLPDLVFTTTVQPQAIACDQLQGKIRQKVQVSETLALAIHEAPGPSRGFKGNMSLMANGVADASESAGAVDVGWTVYGGVDLGTPTTPAPTVAPTIEALKGCPLPTDSRPGQFRRLVAWLEVAPDGSVAEYQVQSQVDSERAWADCVLQRLGELPNLGAQSEGRFSAIELRIDSVTATR